MELYLAKNLLINSLENKNLNSIIKLVLNNKLFQENSFVEKELKNLNYIFVNCKKLSMSYDYEKLGSKLFDYLKKNKIENSYIDINKNYDINVENINLFQSNEQDISIETSYNIKTIEIGFIFDSFRISYKKMNPLESSIIITENKLEFIQYDYIDLVWLFKD